MADVLHDGPGDDASPAAAVARPLRDRLHGLSDWPRFYAALALLGVAQLCWSFASFIIRLAVPEERGRLIGRRCVSQMYRTCFALTERFGILEVDASALDAIDPDQAMILAPNHPSVLDALILISRLEKVGCIMKASVLDNLLLGSGARLAGYIRNDGPKRMLRLSAADLKQGGQLIVFPEGTRTVTAPVNAFKAGFAAMARMAGVPVQTVIIETDTPYLSKGWSVLRKPARLPMHFRVRLGERFRVDGDVETFVTELHRYFVGALADAELGDLRGRPDESVPGSRCGVGPEAGALSAGAPLAREPGGPAYPSGARSLQR